MEKEQGNFRLSIDDFSKSGIKKCNTFVMADNVEGRRISIDYFLLTIDDFSKGKSLIDPSARLRPLRGKLGRDDKVSGCASFRMTGQGKTIDY
jgi:hypothetical protein